MTPRLLPTAVAALALVSTAACVKTVNVGGFALDVPGGWYAEKDEDGALAVGTKHAEWTWVMVSETVDEGEALEDIGQQVASEVAEDETEAGEPQISFGEPQPWSAEGVEGIVMDGELKDPELTVRLRVLVLTTGTEVMVAFGFRSPDADGGDDAKAEAMLDSIRLAGG